MNLDDIIPYKNNPRHNEKAIPELAESIREFGLRGQILLESRDHPVIVCGHTRVAACKSLGWDEFPDEHIAYCDDMTDEQIRAFRLVDNKTGEAATWNKTLLQHEMRGIKKIDMSRFKFDFKSKKEGFRYGQERLKTDKAYNLDLVSAVDCNERGVPRLDPVDVRPEGLQGFNYAKSTPTAEKKARGCHFFIDDYQFERCWTSPLRVLDWLRPYACVLGPDFSLYMDMPEPMMRWNVYRSRALLHIWQRKGLKVVPTLQWAGPSSYDYCFDGMPCGGTVATSTVGVMADPVASQIWADGMAEALRRVKPKRVLLYGSDPDFDFGDVEVVRYGTRQFERSE